MEKVQKPVDTRNSINEVRNIRISIASPEKIRDWSFGEVTKPETINYRTFKPEKDGLFCARIFGPINDYECLCGKYKRPKYKGIRCDKCGVEVTLSKVRRERMGHIELAAPVSHIWFLKALPSRIASLLDMTLRSVEKILYFEQYIVTNAGDTPLEERQLLTETELRQAYEEYGRGAFEAGMGAEAVAVLLKEIDVEELSVQLRYDMKTVTSKQKRVKTAKRLKIADAFRKSGNKPEHMILEMLPVIPPEYRPLVPLDGGRFATSDLNDLYRRVINRNLRLKKLQELRAPEVIMRNEKRMLQEAVDALFDNGRRGKVVKGTNDRPLKSLADTLKGKKGRFRQNLLGKRVDYSGRTVIVVGPELKLNQCGLPKKMALELFKPFIFNELEKRGFASSIKVAKEMVELERPEVWDVLEDVITGHPVMLNRAPTLHRLGIQAFFPILIEGKAIKLHPLVCSAFNADFDGDQMAVHVPLAPTAQLEAIVLMLSTNNLLSPASGRPVAVPSQDMVLGCYYLTKLRPGRKGEGKIFSDFDEVMAAYEAGYVDIHAAIQVRYSGKLMNLADRKDSQDLESAEVIEVKKHRMETTPGRIIFNSILKGGLPFVNGLFKKKGLANLVYYAYKNVGKEQTIKLLDGVKKMGFLYATKGGISFGMDDIIVPEAKRAILENAPKEVMEVERHYQAGEIEASERYNKVVAIWSDVTEEVASVMLDELEQANEKGEFMNPIYIMADSGARGSHAQIRQLAGMRGLMAKPSGEIIETPITANFKEGLSVLQYFVSTHGARKGLADTALKTADSGYLTRRLVDVSQDVIVREEDCGTLDGIWSAALEEQGEIIESLTDRITGRVAMDDINDPYNDDLIVVAGEEITEDLAKKIEHSGIEKVKIRSVLTCESQEGVCQKCYGRNLSTGKLVEMGEAVGIVAAQSIGEPGTQLTMRTFHVGGTASKVSEKSTHEASRDGVIQFKNMAFVEAVDGTLVVISRRGYIALLDEAGMERDKYKVVTGARLFVRDKSKVKKFDKIAEWDPYSFVIIADKNGAVEFKDVVEGLTMAEEVDEATSFSRMKIIECTDEKRQPMVILRNKDREITGKYPLPTDSIVTVEEGEEISAGRTLAKIPRDTTKTMDITGGLPRVVDLFEGRKPKEQSIISEIDGVVSYGKIVRGNRKIFVTSDTGDVREYSIPKGKYIHFNKGDEIRSGEPLIDGPVSPHDILDVLGAKELQKFLINEVQEVYKMQGVSINDKHIEIIIRQMMRWIEVEDAGDSEYVIGDKVDKFEFMGVNDKLLEQGLEAAKGKQLLLGITKAALNTRSFISAASFQETTRVLTEAAVQGKVDHLHGLKENVILGKLIPTGTGFPDYHDFKLERDETIPQEDPARFEIERASRSLGIEEKKPVDKE